MSWKRRALLFALSNLALAQVTAQHLEVQASPDRVSHPPVRREFASPDGMYQLVIESSDQWKTLVPSARLYRRVQGQSRSTLLWSRTLRQQYGPRFAIVSNDGRVLLIDEWINVTSRWALMLLDADNRVLAIHDFDAVVAALDIAPAQVSTLARYGTWISGEPSVSALDRSAQIPSGGSTLVISLDDGRLSVDR